MVPKKLSDKILSNRYIQTVLSKRPDAFLVGGFPRDIIRGVPAGKIKDIDFALPENPKEVSKTVSKELKGTLVELKGDLMYRVALKDGTTLDFSALEGDIEQDLKRRDFTINAVAWDNNGGFIDPFSGIEDINKRVIRHILKKNFKDDPLRLLRAYRFASEMCYRIDVATREQIRGLSGLIRRPATERITLEFFKLLDGKCALGALRDCLSDGLLPRIIPLSSDRLQNNIKIVSKLDLNLDKVPEFRRLSGSKYPQGLSYRGVLMLEAIFLGCDIMDSLISPGSSLTKRISTVNSLINELKSINSDDLGRIFDLFEISGDAVYDLIILTGRTDLAGQAGRYFKIIGKGLLTSEEIMGLAGIKPGPRLGKIIRELRKQRFIGKIRTKTQAYRLIRNIPL